MSTATLADHRLMRANNWIYFSSMNPSMICCNWNSLLRSWSETRFLDCMNGIKFGFLLIKAKFTWVKYFQVHELRQCLSYIIYSILLLSKILKQGRIIIECIFEESRSCLDTINKKFEFFTTCDILNIKLVKFLFLSEDLLNNWRSWGNGKSTSKKRKIRFWN